MTRKAAAHTSQYAEEKPSVNYVSLSKAMSKALRHQPQRLGITLAPDGSVSLDEFIEYSREKGDGSSGYTRNHIRRTHRIAFECDCQVLCYAGHGVTGSSSGNSGWP